LDTQKQAIENAHQQDCLYDGKKSFVKHGGKGQ
jgi:hypothetical protein